MNKIKSKKSVKKWHLRRSDGFRMSARQGNCWQCDFNEYKRQHIFVRKRKKISSHMVTTRKINELKGIIYSG